VRILYILTTLGIGGAEKQAIGVAERMAARGHAVALIALKHADEEWPVKLPVLRLNMRKTPLGIFRALRFVRKFIALFRPDILHSHSFPANIFTRLLRIGKLQASAVNTIHNIHEGGWHRMAIYRLTNSWADRVTAVSTAAAERFVRRHAVSKNKMTILTNGLDVEEFAPDRSRRKITRKRMRVSDDFVWLAAGRIAPAKDYPNLLRAFALVRREHPQAVLWIAGEGDTAPLAPFISDDSGAQFLGLRRDILALLDAADAFVLSSAWEGMPLALGEAMAMQLPFVVTDVGGVHELAGDAGLIVPPKDEKALAGAMLQVMAMGEGQRSNIGRAARERIQQDFSIDAKADEWERLYARLEKRGLS